MSQEKQEMESDGRLEAVGKDGSEIFILSIIGEVEGHEDSASSQKATRYNELIPLLAKIQEEGKVKGLLLLLHTMGGDVEAGLALSELISGMKIPTVSLVLGGGHSIGVPLAVAADYTFISATGTMLVHPVRTSGTVLGVRQSYEYMKRTRDRIVSFVCEHSDIKEEVFLSLMLETESLTRDMGTLLVGEEAVETGLIQEVGTLSDALKKLHEMIANTRDV